MKKVKVLILTLIIVMSFSSIAFAENLSSFNPINVNISPMSYVEDVLDYTIKTYAYDSYGQALIVSTEKFYKRIQFPNGYELSGTSTEEEFFWWGYKIYTYYEYETY